MNLFQFSIVKLLVAVSLLVEQPRWGIAVSDKRLLYAVWRNGLLTQTTFSLQTLKLTTKVVKPKSAFVGTRLSQLKTKRENIK